MQTRIYFALLFPYSISLFLLTLILILISFSFSFSLFNLFPTVAAADSAVFVPDSAMSLCGVMEFFLELALTISVPLLLTCFLSKLLSVAAAGEELAPVGFDFGFGSRIRNLESRKPSVVVVEDSVGGGDEIVESKQDNFTGIVESRGETDGALIGSVRTVEEGVDSDFDHRGGDCGGEVAEKVIDESSVRASSGGDDCGGEVAEKVFDESSVRARSEETGVCPRDGVEGVESDRSKEEGSAAEEIVVEDDDWEGIERTELEEQFEAAVKFVKIHNSEDPNFCNELKMRLSGLHKIAMQGPCSTESPSMALKIFARFKWNAWKELGNMSPEVAMESYINLVSENIPGWKETPLVNSDQDASQTHESEKLVSKTESL